MHTNKDDDVSPYQHKFESSSQRMLSFRIRLFDTWYMLRNNKKQNVNKMSIVVLQRRWWESIESFTSTYKLWAQLGICIQPVQSNDSCNIVRLQLTRSSQRAVDNRITHLDTCCQFPSSNCWCTSHRMYRSNKLHSLLHNLKWTTLFMLMHVMMTKLQSTTRAHKASQVTQIQLNSTVIIGYLLALMSPSRLQR